MLTVSTPGASVSIVGKVGELSQDIRFGFLSSSFPSWFGGFFLTTRNSPNNRPVSRLQIFPGSVSVAQDEQIVFTAIGYDAQDAPVSGINIRWRVADTGRRLRERPLRDGRFEARVFGTFTVTAESRGRQAQVTVTVTPRVGRANQSNSETPINISSRSIAKKSNTGVEETSKKSGQEPPTPLLPDDGDWGDENWYSADDPGNLPGNPPGTPADDGAGSGNFQLSAPVVSLPGRGIDLALNLNYNSRLWNKSGSQLTYDIDKGFPAPGWSLGFGKILDLGAGGGSLLIDADGTRHGFSGTITPFSGGFSWFRGHTTDGKFIDYSSARDNGGIYWANAYFPNGTYISYGAKADGGVYPTFIREAQGNFISITYRNNQGPAIQTITDTLGRIVTFDYDSLGRLIAVKAPRMQGQDPIYGSGTTRTLVKIHYKPLSLNYSFAAGITAAVRNNTPWAIDAIYYPPTNTGYWFGADPNAPDYSAYYSTYGMLTKVVEQRGMNWQTSSEEQGMITAGQMTKQAVYNYPLTTANETGRTNGIGLTDAPTYETLTESWAGADVAESAVTTYNIQQNASPRTTTVIQPNGTVSRQLAYNTPGQFTDGLIYQDESYIPDANGITIPNVAGTFKLVGRSNVTWQEGEYDAPRPFYAEIWDENNQKVSTQYSYTGGRFNQITRSCDYNNGNILLRCATASYENSAAYIGQFNGGAWQYGRHIFNLVTTTGVENADSTRASWTEYEYDNYQNQPFTAASEVVQHEASHDVYTTETYWVQGECLQWEEYPGGGDYFEPYCVEYNYYEVSAYDYATEKRGNVTKTTVYADANNLSGAIANTGGYDVTGNRVKASTSCCEQTTVEYGLETQYAYPKSQTRGSADINSPHRITTNVVYDKDTGLIKQQTDANGRTQTSMYNPDTLRPVKSISSTNAYAVFLYDDTLMTVTEETREADGNLAGKSVKYLNGLGQVRKEEAFGPNSIVDIVETKYTKYGEEWKQSRPYRTGDTPQWTERTYDSQRRVTQVIEPDGSISKAFYNETARPDSASSLAGNTIRTSDAWGRERWGRYDQQGRLAEVVEPNPTGSGSVLAAGSLMTKYTQDTIGRLTKTEQDAQIREFKYDDLGRLTRQKLAEQTATLNDAGVFIGAEQIGARWSEAFFYDTRSNLTQKTDARGVKTLLSYQTGGADDPLNRLQARNYDLSGPRDTSLNILYAPGVSYEYMTTGDKSRIKKVRTAGILTEDYAYDAESRVSNYTQTIDERTSYPMEVSYLYDSLDRVTEVRYPAQYFLSGSPRKRIEQFYDTASRLTSLKIDDTEVAGNIAYNAADQTTSIKIGAAGANQVTENYTFDQQTGLLTNQTLQKGAVTVLDLSYDYNRNNSVGTLNGKTGHLTKIIDNLFPDKSREYEFDALGRLTKAKGGNNRWTQNYSYDRYGNRTNVTALGVAANDTPIPSDGIPNLTYNAQNNRITTEDFYYDVAGNQTRALGENGIWLNYEYDAANRLQVVKKDDGTYLQAFQFGSTNARLMSHDYQTNQLTMSASVGGTTLAEYTEFSYAVMTWTKSYTYLGDSQLSTITRTAQGGEQTEFNHPDRLGTRVITNQASGASYEQTTLPFGTALNAESTVQNNSKRFTSYERSAQTGLDYAINRTYDSKLGRFTQVDPIGMRAVSLSSPQTLNLYTYCGNDPINHTDRDGLFWGFLKKLFKWVMVAVAVIIAAITIVGVFAAPTIVGIFSAISAGATAASQVLTALGYRRAGFILGLIAVAAGFGSVIAGKIGAGNFVSEGARRNPSWFGAINGVGAVANSLRTKKRELKSNKCDHWLGIYYSLLKPHFDTLWERTQKSKSEKAPDGLEQGGVIYISNSNVSIGGIEENGIDIYDGRTSKDTMGDEFNDWVIEKKRVRGLKGDTTLVVHTHPRGEGKPSGGGIYGDYSMAKNSPEAVVGLKEISVYNGKKILCTIKR